MRRFPLEARLFVWAVVAAGGVAFALMWHLGFAEFFTGQGNRLLVLLALGALSVIASFWKVRLFGEYRVGEHSSKMSLGFVPTFFSLLTYNPFVGAIVATIGYIPTALYPKASYYFQILFSIAAIALSVLASGLILQQFGLSQLVSGDEFAHLDLKSGAYTQILAIFLATLTYYLLNTVLVAVAISLTTGRNPFQTWKEHYLWTGPGYFAGASCATVVHLMVSADRDQTINSLLQVLLIFLIASPILFLTYYSYRIYMDKVNASERHIRELEKGKAEMEQLYLSTVESLALAIDAKDPYTKEHILRVQKVAGAIATEMGVSGDEWQAIHHGALMHDIGKLGIPEHILGKPGKLTESEFEKIKAHPVIGAMILEPVRFPWPVTPAVRSHHERWDGRGYPDGLTSEEIPLGARILAVADVYDALTSERSYRDGWTHQEACDYILANAGSHFDPKVVEVFLRVMESDPGLCRGGPRHAPGASVDASPRTEVAEGIKRASFEYISLYEISQTVSVTLNLKETLSLVAGKITSIFGADTCVLLLLEGSDLRAAMAAGLNEPFFRGAQTRLAEGVTGVVAVSGEGFLGLYDRGDLLLESAHDAWVPLHSALIVPLFAEDRIVGTINLYHRQENAFDAEDMRVLLAVSAQAGRAIQNAREFEKTRESALTDPLTGLYNARYLALFLEQEVHRAQREQRPLSVLVMDLDDFKPINDTWGHPQGDRVLCDVGALLRACLRGGDLVARYAGDEFVAVLPGTGAADSLVVIDKIKAAMRAYDPGASGDDLRGQRLGISIGSASYPGDAADAATLVACADAAMYRDKSSNKAGRSASHASQEGALSRIA